MHIPARFGQKNIHTFPIFLSLFFFWAGVYRDPEEAAAVMETAGAETLSVFPSEIPPGAVRIPAAEEVMWNLGRGGVDGQSESTPSGNNASQREGWLLLGSQLCLGKGKGWESFSSEIPGAGWEGSTAGSVLVRVATAFPSNPTLSPWLQTQHFPAVQCSPSTGLFPCCPLMMASALEFPQKAVKWQKERLEARRGCRARGAVREPLTLLGTRFFTSKVMLDFG